jgi:hypothetical protein
VTDAETDAAYRHIGRWMVEFSRIGMFMRLAIETRFAKGRGYMEPKIVLGVLTADQITGVFFELCSLVGEPDDLETKTLAWLREQVRQQNSRRNDFAHGDWLGSPEDLALSRTKPGRKDEAWSLKEMPPAELMSGPMIYAGWPRTLAKSGCCVSIQTLWQWFGKGPCA